MPFKVGDVAPHDDEQHTGSAKRNAANGVAGLDASSRVAQANSYLVVPSLNTGKLIDTEYQNGARPRLILITIECRLGATDTSSAYVALGTKSVAGVVVTDSQMNAGLNIWTAPLVVNLNARFSIMHVIPANYFYNLISTVSDTGVVTVVKWHEVDL